MSQADTSLTISPAKMRFAQAYAFTDNASEAVRKAYPELAKHSSPAYVAVKGHRLLRDDKVLQAIDGHKAQLIVAAGMAVDRLAELIASDDERVAGQTARWVYEQVHGRATRQAVSVKPDVARVCIDLSGGSAGGPPDEVLRHLEQ